MRETKKCKDCGTEKHRDEFYELISSYKNKEYKYLQSYCKKCSIIRCSERAKSNPEKTKEQQDHWRLKNKGRMREYYRDYTEKNKEKLKEYRRKYFQEKLKTDLNFRITNSLRARFKTALKLNYKSGSAIRDLGCSIDELIKHLEVKFEQNMSWENYGEWHIDHIIPLSAFDLSDRNEFLIACHYLNLQSLWAKPNLNKHDTLPPQEQIDELVKTIALKRGLIK